MLRRSRHDGADGGGRPAPAQKEKGFLIALTPRQAQIVDILTLRPEATYREVSETLGVEMATVRCHFNLLAGRLPHYGDEMSAKERVIRYVKDRMTV